jgi:helicase MOV-10
MFYDNELRPCADVVLRNSLCHWSGLKKKGFPVIFEAVWGKDEREENSPSFFNPQEISVVLRYVTQLKEARGISLNTSEIGVISPYHKQVSCLFMS